MDLSKIGMRTGKNLGSIANMVLPLTHVGFNSFLFRYIVVATIGYLILGAAGPSPPGFLGVGLMKSVRDFLLETLPFAIVAWALSSKSSKGDGFVGAGILLTSAVVYVVLKNLPVNSTAPSWVINGKTAVVNTSLALTQGFGVAVATML